MGIAKKVGQKTCKNKSGNDCRKSRVNEPSFDSRPHSLAVGRDKSQYSLRDHKAISRALKKDVTVLIECCFFVVACLMEFLMQVIEINTN